MRIAMKVVLILGFLFVAARPGSAADDAAVQRAIQRGAAFLRTNLSQQPDGDDALTALAMLKAGDPPNSPGIQAVISKIRAKIRDGVYEPGPHHIYEAGVDASLLSDVAAALSEQQQGLYLAELTAIANYLVENQRPGGGWDYPSRPGTVGDTSVVQYAMLGLWATARGGVEVDPGVWQRAISWHIAQQNSDGGFRYRPGHDPAESTLNMTINAIGSSYIAMLHIDPANLPDITDPRIRRQDRPSEGSRSIGVLEQVDLDNASRDEIRQVKTAEIPDGTAQFLTRAYNWIVPRFAAVNNTPHFKGYYYYSLERMAALAEIEQLGDAAWFDICAAYLIDEQLENGSWSMTSAQFAGTTRDTCFAVLFLTRSTGKILGHREPYDPLGAGLMAGARGLGGGDLKDLRIDSSGRVVEAKDLGPLDDMLAALSDLGDGGIDEVQRQIVEKVQIGDREALIENKDRLIELVAYENPDDPDHAAEVRRTAVWALGRTNDLSLVRLLIEALDDVSFSVMLESRNALCWLARRPNGLGEANDPLESVPENASPDQRQAAIAAWHAEAFRNWGEWYLRTRPYEDRGDEFEAWLLDRMSEL